MSNMYMRTILLLASFATTGCFYGDLEGKSCSEDKFCGEGLECLGGYPGGSAGGKCSVPVAPDLAVSIGVGAYHSCAVMGSGKVRCWGSNHWEELGYPELPGSDKVCGSPSELGDVQLMSDSRVRMVFGGGGKYSFADDLSHTCVLQADGKVTCWGKGTDDTTGWLGQVLEPAVWGDPSKIKALDLDDVKQIAVGPLMTCALLGGVQDGDLICWGGGGAPNGKNRDETTQPVSMLTPVIIPNGETPTQISIGVAHACAIVTDGSVYCWGDGTNGQLGDGRCMNVDAAPQYPAKNIPPVRAVAAGRYHTCALVADDKRAVWCWGSNVNLSLGIGKTGIPPECPNSDEYGYLSVPSKTISFGANIRQLVAGDKFSCFLTESGTVHCWGLNNSGQLGLSRNDPQELKEPTEVNIDKIITQISARRSTTCALTEDGEVWCWGDNSYGQAGTTTCEQKPLVDEVALPHKISLVRPIE